MSGDETDCPPAAKPKALWRLELPWINPGISRLFQSVETYESAHRMENMLEQVGNLLLKHCWEARRKEGKSTPIPGLPCNWYNDDWFKGLTAGICLMLSVRKDITIPSLVSPMGIAFKPEVHALHRNLMPLGEVVSQCR